MLETSTINLDISKKSAKLLMPLFTFDAECEEDARIILDIGTMEDMVASRDGMKISVHMWYDFGTVIPKECWTMFGRDSLIGALGTREADQLTGQFVLEAVRKMYPQVARELGKWATEAWSERASKGEIK